MPRFNNPEVESLWAKYGDMHHYQGGSTRPDILFLLDHIERLVGWLSAKAIEVKRLEDDLGNARMDLARRSEVILQKKKELDSERQKNQILRRELKYAFEGLFQQQKERDAAQTERDQAIKVGEEHREWQIVYSQNAADLFGERNKLREELEQARITSVTLRNEKAGLEQELAGVKLDRDKWMGWYEKVERQLGDANKTIRSLVGVEEKKCGAVLKIFDPKHGWLMENWICNRNEHPGRPNHYYTDGSEKIIKQWEVQ